MNYWLLKSEPSVYGIDRLESERVTIWDGVRNYQARNFLKSMEVGDLAFFYHSNTKPPGIVGLMKVIESQAIDPSQFDKVEFVRKFDRQIELNELRDRFTPEELLVVKQGTRLSVMPIVDRVAEKLLQLSTDNLTPNT
jgi:predicted RNA-binding protein with PUA-like domain